MGFFASRVTMNYQMAHVLPEEDPDYIAFEEFKSLFGQDGSVLVLGLEDASLYQLDNFTQWYDLCKGLKEINGVDEVMSLTEILNVAKHAEEKRFVLRPLFEKKPDSQSYLDSVLAEIKNLPFYENVLYKKDSPLTLIALTLDRKVLDSKQRIELIGQIQELGQRFSEQTDLELHYSGMPFIRANSTSKVSNEIRLFILLAVIVTSLILLLFFRSFMVTFFSMFVVLVGVVWAFGFLGLFGYKITMLTGLIPPLIIVIGIPNSIFLLNKYHQEYRNHGNQIKALSRVIQKIGNAIFLTNVTTSLGFAAFIFTDSNILVEFGTITSLSILSVFLLSITLIPIIFSFRKPPMRRHIRHLENRWMSLAIHRMIHWVVNRRKLVYVITIITVIISIYGISKIETTGNFADDLPRDDKVYTDLKFFENGYNGVMPFEILIDTKKKEKAMKLSTLKKINRLHKVLAEYKEFSRPYSIVDGIKYSKQAFYNGNPKKYDLPNNQEKSFLAPYFSNANDSSKILYSFVDSSKRYTRVNLQIKDIGTQAMDTLLASLKPQIDSLFNPEKFTVTTTGTSVVFLKGTTYLVKNLLISLFLAILVISVLMSVLFSSIKMVLVSLIPNLLPLVVTAAAMGYLGIPIKPSTILIFSIAFGISVDDTIHYLAKYRQELNHHRSNLKTAVLNALRETGVSMIYSSIILFFGFGVFTASDFGGTVALGMLVSFTLLVAMNANLILLPSLLLSLEKRVVTKAFRKEALLEILDEEEDIDLDELRIK